MYVMRQNETSETEEPLGGSALFTRRRSCTVA